MGERRCASMATMMAVCAFVASGTLPIRAIWIEIPALSRQVPEGSNFYIYVLVISECSNIASIVYFLIRKCSHRHQHHHLMSDARIIYFSLVLAIVSMIVPGLIWKNTIGLPGINISFSFTLLLSVLLSSSVASLSTITYIPFVSRLNHSYLSAAMFGDALASLIPHVMALLQGIGRQPDCLASDHRSAAAAAADVAAGNNTSSSSSVSLQLLSSSSDLPRPTAGLALPIHQTTALVLPLPAAKAFNGSSLQFSEQTYFLANAGVLCLGLVSFFAIRCTTSFKLDAGGDARLTGTGAGTRIEVRDQPTAGKRGKMDQVWQSKKAIPPQSTTVLDDGTVRQSGILLLHHHQQQPTKHLDPNVCAEQTPLTGDSAALGQSDEGGDTATNDFATRSHHIHLHHHQSKQQPQLMKTSTANPLRRYGRVSSTDRLAALKAAGSASHRPKLFPLLMLIVLWSSFLMSGPLSTVYTYSCYSVGNHAFLVGVILCDVFTLLSCILSSRTTEMSVVIAFSCLGTILLTYFLALIIFTLETQTKEVPPFGNTGEILAVFIWVSIVALFSFARLRIGIECQAANGTESLLWFVWIVRLGDVLGLLTAFRRINICRIFRVFDKPCLI